MDPYLQGQHLHSVLGTSDSPADSWWSDQVNHSCLDGQQDSLQELERADRFGLIFLSYKIMGIC